MQRTLPRKFSLLCLLMILPACNLNKKKHPATEKPDLWSRLAEPLYPVPGPDVQTLPRILIEHVRIMTAAGKTIPEGYVLIEAGQIAKVGEGEAPEVKDVLKIEGRGKVVTPGIIDMHSHIGVYPLPGAKAHQDGNEATAPTTPDVWAEHSFWPQDPALWRALASGVTTIHVLPGSANLIGGRTVTLHVKPATSVAAMRFPEAPQGIKMACGENPKRVYGEKNGPSTRMGNIAGFRRLFQEAWEYRQSWLNHDHAMERWNKSGDGERPGSPKRDHALDTITKVLNGEILVHVHCYRADEMSIMLDLARTYGFHIQAFHHALEAYKIRDRLAAEKVAIATWADWWGFKLEAFDGIPANAPMLHAAGGLATIHSDSEDEIRYLNLEAAKAQTAGREFGIEVSDDEILQWITRNPAIALGIESKVGTIAEGKMADVVLWDRHPFSAYAKPEKVFVGGEMLFDRITQLFPLGDLERGVHDYGLGDRGNQKDALPGTGVPESPIRPALPAEPRLQDSFVIEHATVETGTGQRLTDTSIWVEKGIIQAIGGAGAPKDRPRIDAQGRVLTPGWIESQTQLGALVVELEEAGQDHDAGDGLNPAFHALDGWDPFSMRMPIAREQGVTTIIAKPSGGIISGQGVALDLSTSRSALQTPAAPVMFASVLGGKNRGQTWLKLREAFEDARFYKQQGATKTAVTQQLSLRPMHLEALQEVMQGRLPLVLSVHRLSDVLTAIQWKKEMASKGFPVQLILSGAGEAWLAARELAEAKIPVIVTPSRQMPRTLDQLRVRDDQATLLMQASVDVIISTDDVRAGRLRQEAARAVAFSLPYASAVAAISSVPARVFGLNDRGAIEVGKRADLVLWSGDPLEPQSAVQKLWIAGQDMGLNHRQKELTRAYLPKVSAGAPQPK
ncbi:MAG TPA: amidohydrolase family protein [Oligoflexus sp.]|uniref:amidohydrolase family protein n=1 Tax=Oligoflexus sp. TaxID=1971216 RepID=UPI002D2483C3|nr:amidohydrolase family protein [Oligoflexus sp.]HYX37046.1 amidohydrolase family protein [Oligoflexus sp.]